MRTKTTLKKQQRLILAAAAALAVLLPLYFFGIAPLLREDMPPDTKQEIGPHGETMKNGRPFIVDPVQTEDISEIILQNKFGRYRFYRENNRLLIEGYENILYDEQKIPLLRTAVAYLLAIEELTEIDLSDLRIYGIDRENPASFFRVTDRSGDSYTVLVGDPLPSGDGYYVMLEGREAVYLLERSLEEVVLCDINDYFLAYLAPSVSQSEYYSCQSFSLKKNGALFIDIELVAEQNSVTFGNQGVHRLTFPGAYSPSLNNYSLVLETFLSFAGERVVEAKIDPEKLLPYGLCDETGAITAAYELSYQYSAFRGIVYFSQLTENGSYYAYSPGMDIIAEVPAQTLPFLQWDLINWVNRDIFSMNINDIASIRVEFSDVRADFLIQGSDQELTVTESGAPIDTDNFRRFYRSLLYIAIVGYEAPPADKEPDALLTVVTDYGETLEYRFYPVSDRKSYFTINGSGEFYVSRDKITRLYSDTQKIKRGEPVE